MQYFRSDSPRKSIEKTTFHFGFVLKKVYWTHSELLNILWLMTLYRLQFVVLFTSCSKKKYKIQCNYESLFKLLNVTLKWKMKKFSISVKKEMSSLNMKNMLNNSLITLGIWRLIQVPILSCICGLVFIFSTKFLLWSNVMAIFRTFTRYFRLTVFSCVSKEI